ncbi:hypothetical protein ASZ90_003324 [hydrocarbon metagenome]|uniref:Uncharacterized protein n=1 Tax=hydrocarbon metagenome TaxID=938273 RepID=A0A0W8G0Z5_9ZZZZ
MVRNGIVYFFITFSECLVSLTKESMKMFPKQGVAELINCPDF